MDDCPIRIRQYASGADEASSLAGVRDGTTPVKL